ncbi:ABC transporter permease [Salininema proteolyticum]|uniref:ABC transporter permease n=1 Tax=Salininema proteolyticum TaxID=1607685 RepID=A0ABV8TTH2_9ACTN
MNTAVNSYRAGMRRAKIALRVSLTTPSDLLGYVLPIAISLTVLFFLRNTDYDGAAVSLGSMSVPSLLGMNLVFGGVLGVTGVLVMDRTTGTLLRAKSLPGGTTGYLVGEIASIGAFTMILSIAFAGAGLLLFDGLVFDSPQRWLMFLAILVLGQLSTLPLGAVLGALINNPRNMGLVTLPIMGLIGISGIFYPIATLPGWVQGIGQTFPMYWLGLGMRHAFLPDSMAAVEIGGTWRTPMMFAVLAAWTIASMAVAPVLLRRMARRESGSAVAVRREKMQQMMTGQ